MLLSDYFLPAPRAALYRFLATYPGLRVETGVQGIVGGTGTGVSWGTPGNQDRTMIVFDPKTYACLAFLTWGQGHEGGLAVTRIVIVNQTGQLP